MNLQIFENSQNLSRFRSFKFLYRSWNRHHQSVDPSLPSFFFFFFFFLFFFLRSYGNYACARMAYLIQWNEPLTSLFSHTMTTRSRNTTDHTHTRAHTSVHYTHATSVYRYTRVIVRLIWFYGWPILRSHWSRRWRNEVIIESSVLNYFEVLWNGG